MSEQLIVRRDRRGRLRAWRGERQVPIEPFTVVRPNGVAKPCPTMLGPDDPELPTIHEEIGGVVRRLRRGGATMLRRVLASVNAEHMTPRRFVVISLACLALGLAIGQVWP